VTLPAWYDVDDIQGLRRMRRDIFEPNAGTEAPLAPSRAIHTRALLTRMFQAGDLEARMGAPSQPSLSAPP
jgi:hypothetical protein